MPRRSLRFNLVAGTIDGTAYSVMVGVGETFLPAFVLALSLGEVASGLVATVPFLLGAILQLATPAGVRWLGSNKRWVIGGCFLQAAAFLPLIVGALRGTMPAWAVFTAGTLYWAGGMAAGPAWASWIATLVPRRVRRRYFGRRGRINQAGVLSGFVIGGMILALSPRPLLGFAAMFAIAGCARLVCAGFLALQHEPRPIPFEPPMGPRALLRRITETHEGGLLCFLVLAQASANIAQPFLNPFFLEDQAFGYARYVALVAAAFLGKAIVLPTIGQIAHAYGVRRVQLIGAFGLVPLPLLWMIPGGFWYLLIVQMIGGAAWAAFEYSTLLMFFESLTERDRTRLMTSYNVADAFARVGGSLLGGWLLTRLCGTHEAYVWVFGASVGARTLAALVLVRLRPPAAIDRVELATSAIAVRAGGGSIDQPEG